MYISDEQCAGREHAASMLMARENRPFYLFDRDSFAGKIQWIEAQLLPGNGLCYAMKCNPFLAADAANTVDRIEVCSYGEYQICLARSVPPEKLLFSGVLKKKEETAQIVRTCGERSRYTAESLSQLSILEEAAAEQEIRIRVFLRLEHGNQFGMSAEEILDVCAGKERYPHLMFQGIHYFSGTNKRRPEMLQQEMKELDGFLLRLGEQGTLLPELEYGGGIPVRYFADQEPPEEWQYFAMFRDAVRALQWKGTVTMELGREAAAECGSYFARVSDIKHRGNASFCILDGGIHQLVYDGQCGAMHRPFLRVYSSDGKEKQKPDGRKWVVCGSLCTHADTLVRGAALPELKIGDVMEFEKAGAYSCMEGMALFLSHEFPAVYTWSGQDGLCRRRGPLETWKWNGGEEKG